ncbi:protein kinase domain-containing protein [Nocardia tengchongensis]
MSSPNHPLTVGSRFGPYRLDRLIGRGGMGEVYQAYDTVKDRTVAIKVLPERLAEDTVYRQRFQRESHAAARLREAHVVPIHDYGEIEGRLFIDMRLVDGDSLRSLLHRHGPGTPEDAVSVTEQVAAALDAAHRDGLLHRDVKPDNILVTHEGFVYLVDFGIAQSATDESLTQDGGAVGSYRYMAPERFSSRDLAPASDVYGLACVLFECLTGTRPFAGGTDAQIMRAHLFDPIPRPSLVRPTVPAAFDAVIARGMAKDPAERYRGAGELAAAARAAVTIDPDARTSADATPATPVPAAATAGARRPRPRRAAAVLGALVLVAGALTFAGWAHSRHTTPGTPIGNASALRGADIELLALTNGAGYHRTNCVHAPTDETATSYIVCDSNPAASAPAARFFRFRTANALHGYYNSFLGIMAAANCPFDPAGKDGPLLDGGKEIGRRACYLDRSTGTSGLPAVVLTDEAELAMATYIWDRPDQTALRDYVVRTNGGLFRNREDARDPDDFSDGDAALLSHLNPPYVRANCRHTNPQVGPINAILSCDTKIDDPAVAFIGVPNREIAKTVYQADLSQFSGHACGGGNGPDDVWRKQTGGPIGRFFCFTDKTVDPPRPILAAVHEDLHLLVQLTGSAPDYPGDSPKNDAALLAWFQKYFTN